MRLQNMYIWYVYFISNKHNLNLNLLLQNINTLHTGIILWLVSKFYAYIYIYIYMEAKSYPLELCQWFKILCLSLFIIQGYL